MELLALLACTGTTVTDSTTDPVDSHTEPLDSDTGPGDSDTAPASGTLTATPSQAMVTETTLEGVFDKEILLDLHCVGDAATALPEEHAWTAETTASEHTAVLRGLLADTTYTCGATNADAEVTFTTGSLPEGLTTYEFTLETWAATAQKGWTLLAPLTFVSLFEQLAIYLVVLDMEGQVRWYKDPGAADGIITFDYNPQARAFWSGGGLIAPVAPTAYDLSGNAITVLSSLPDHDVDWFEDSAYTLRATGQNPYCIEERTWADDTVRWEVCGDDLGHGDLKLNALDVRRENGEVVIYGGSASSSQAVKLHRDRKESLWVIGDGADFTGIPEFTYTHDFNGLDCDGYDSCIAYYDNREEDVGSQAVIWGLDESKGIATELFSWEEEGWYEPRLGGMQVLDDGHVLVGRGHLELLAPAGGQTWVAEVDGSGEVVWRVLLGPLDRSIYRARRVPACELFGHIGYCESLASR